MAVRTPIEWTHATWNPVTGCSKVSAGCLHCYAERMAKRLLAMGNPNYRNGFQVTLHEHMLEVPLSWKKPRLVFVNSMSDLFHTKVPFSFTDRVFATMRSCPQHTFQVLTKRSGKMLSYSRRPSRWPQNVWMGVTVESGRYVHRISDLQQVATPVRFLSLEPLIAPVPRLPLEGIHWVIVGGESGQGARPMNKEWVHEVRRQCQDAGVPFFFKQWGGVRKDLTGRELDGRMYSEVPDAHPEALLAGSLLAADR